MIPLRRLPKRALDIVLKNMTTMKQLFISLCNKSFKSQIHLLNTGIDFEFRIMIGEVFRIYVLSPDRGSLGLYFHTNESEDWSRKEGEPKRTFAENDTVLITYIANDWKYGKRFDANNSKKSARQWILLLILFFDSIKETLRGLKLETLEITGNAAMSKYQEILKSVPPSDNFVQDSIQEVENYQNVLIQNFVAIDISFHSNFSDVLLNNSKFALIPGERFTIKNLNQFLKLWIKGSNPNAKLFSIDWVPLWNDEDVEDVLKGIPYEVIPYTVERSLLNVPDYVPDADKKIRGGYGIRRMVDGAEATVKLDCFSTAFSFELFVWDE
ncbi:hypothetical protein CAEBREN_04364 [Caenorhabditis brenneri]|uniref:Sdz-33 F-box domain-containing protein n=1 Tax=Caenorhabditis brenneri TaxID=135651 RepID=G0MBP4_CAEBE|nr:hypothetical protein CAEBREN_04364 [Caenorhabditis brenneri]